MKKSPRPRKLRSKSKLKVRPIREVERPTAKPNAGQFKAGNTASLKHGLFSTRARQALLPGQKNALAALAEDRTELLTDLGGVETVGLLKRKAVTATLELEVIKDTLATNLIQDGVLTGKGQSRAVLSAYLGVVDRLMRLYSMLGLERRAKQVESLEQFIREHEGEKES